MQQAHTSAVGFFPKGLFKTSVKAVRSAHLARKARPGDPLFTLQSALKTFKFAPPPGAISYFGAKHLFSHLHPVGINFNGRRWVTVEQAYQTACAELAGDYATVAALASASTGRDHKLISKQIDLGRHRPVWAAAAHFVMLSLDLAKYSQNPAAGKVLTETGSRYLYENSPTDLFWGPPCNVAGEILMEVRRRLEPSARPPTTLWIGDSLLSDFPRFLKDDHQVVAIPGAGTLPLTRLAPWLVNGNIRRVIICAGTNDLFVRNASPPRVAHRPAKVVRYLRLLATAVRKAHPAVTIYVVELPARHCEEITISPRCRGPAGVAGVNAGLRAASRAGTFGAQVLATPLLDRTHLAPDGLHLTLSTVQRLAHEWVAQLDN